MLTITSKPFNPTILYLPPGAWSFYLRVLEVDRRNRQGHSTPPPSPTPYRSSKQTSVKQSRPVEPGSTEGLKG